MFGGPALRTFKWWLIGGVLLLTLAAHGADAIGSKTGITLDLPVDWAPVVCGGRIYLFSSNGRNQILSEGETAPECDPVQFVPGLQPLCGPDGTLVLDRDGNLWRLGSGFPKTIQGDLKGAIALFPSVNGLTVLFKDRLRLPDGEEKRLAFEIQDGLALSDGGFWLWGRNKAMRLDASGETRWTWTPTDGNPGPAALAEGLIFSATSRGDLVALRDSDGRMRFSYRGGGALVGPPRIIDDLVIYGSLDHFIRAVNPRNGQLAWQYRAEGRPAFGPFPVKAGLLFAETGGTRLVVLSVLKGKKLWEWDLPSGAILQSPAFSDGYAVVLAWGEASVPTLYRVALPEPKTPAKARDAGKR
jgi:outer membrane protein assembly factor BamB